MKQRVLQVKFKKRELPEGEQHAPSVEVSAGEYSRKFVRRQQPFTLRGEEEMAAVLHTRLFEVVEGSERFEEPAPPAAATREQPPEQRDEQQGGQQTEQQ